MTAKFRQNMGLPLAAVVAFVGASALATQRWWLLPILLIPLVVAVWGFRSGVDADRQSLRVRTLLGSRTVPWGEVAGFRVDRNKVLAQLSSGGELPLPAVTPRQLPALIAAGGRTLENDAQ